MYCSQCGQKLLEGASYCTNCGMKIVYQEQDITKEMINEEPVVQEQPVEETSAYDTPEQPEADSFGFETDAQAAEEYEDYVFAGAASKEEYEAQQAKEQAGAGQNTGQNAEYGYGANQGTQPNYAGTSRAAAIVGYITWIGFIVAIVIGDRNDPHTRFHTNQALVLNIAAIICLIIMVIPIIGTIIGIIGYILIVIGWFVGIISAAAGTMGRAPLFGKINLIG